MNSESKGLLFLAGVVAPAFGLILAPQEVVRLAGQSALAIKLSSIGFMIVFSTWCIRTPKSSIWSGVLCLGGVFASLSGLAMLPLTIVGMAFFGLGLLGLIPFFTAWAYFKAGRSAWSAGSNGGRLSHFVRIGMAILAAISYGGGLFLASQSIKEEYSRSVLVLKSGGDPQQFAASPHIHTHALLVGLDSWVWIYTSEKSEERRIRIKHVYEKLTGTGIESRARILDD